MSKFNELPYLAQIGIIVAVVLLLAGGSYYYFLEPLSQANEQDLRTLQSKQAEIQQLAPYATKLATLNSDVEKLKAQIEEQRKIVPEEKEVPGLMRLVQHEAAVSGIEVRRYTPRATVAKEYYSEAPFEVDVDGPYYAVLNFFERVAKMDRIVNVTGLTMSGVKSSMKAPVKKTYAYAPTETVIANCVITAFYSPAQPQGPKPAPKPAAGK